MSVWAIIGWGYLACVLGVLGIFAHHEWGERQADRKRHGMRVSRGGLS